MAHFPVLCTEAECIAWAGKPEEAAKELYARVEEAYLAKCTGEIPEALPMLERMVCLTAIDEEWQKFLAAMDDLRRSVGLRGYGQRDPLVEYKREAFEMFTELMGTIKAGIVRAAFTTTTNVEAYIAMRERMARRAQTQHRDLGDLTATASAAMPAPAAAPAMETVSGSFSGSFTVTAPGLAEPEEPATESEAPQGNGSLEALLEAMNNRPQQPMPVRSGLQKTGRNDPCPCGSGKKYKNCCGR